MPAARIIPCLDVKDGRVVKGVQFVDLVDAGDLAPEVVEHLVEDRHVLRLRDEDRAHAEVDVAAVGDVHHLHAAERVHDLRGRRQQLAGAQLATERHHVALEVGVLGATP